MLHQTGLLMKPADGMLPYGDSSMMPLGLRVVCALVKDPSLVMGLIKRHSNNAVALHLANGITGWGWVHSTLRDSQG